MSTRDEPTDTPTLTPEMIERFRQVGLRLDRDGRLWHQGEQITHPGLHRAVLRWLDVREDGRAIVRLDDRRYAYIDVDDAHLLVVSAQWRGDRAFVTLNDGSEQELDYASLRVGAGDALYCTVRGGRLEARVTTPAYYVLAENLESPGDDRFALRARDGVYPIGRRS